MFKKISLIGTAFLMALAVHLIYGAEPAFAVDLFGPGELMALPIGFGMLVNAVNIESIFINLKTLFNKAFDTAPSSWQEIAMEVPSTGASNNYKWLSSWPKLRKWVGDKILKSLAAHKYVIENDDFEATVEVDRNDIKDDQLGMYKPQAEMAGQSAKEWPDDLVYDVVNAAFTTECYDGQYFFDTDHPVGDGKGGTSSVSNKLTAVLSNATLAAAQASFGAAKLMMANFTDDEQRSLNTKQTVLHVGSALEDMANMLMKNDKLADGTPNPYKGQAKVVTDTRISSATYWAILDTSKAIKPFIFQPREKPYFVKQTDPESDTVFMRKKFLFGAEARGNAGFGLWQLGVGSTGAG